MNVEKQKDAQEIQDHFARCQVVLEFMMIRGFTDGQIRHVLVELCNQQRDKVPNGCRGW